MSRLLYALVILFVAACAGPAVSSSPATTTATLASGDSTKPAATLPDAPASTATSSPSQSPARPWPTVGAAPAASTTAGMYLAYGSAGDVWGYADWLVIFSDGLVLIEGSPSHPDKFVTRRLAASGLAFVQSQVAEVGLFDRSQTRKVVHLPSEGRGAGASLITIVVGGKKVEVVEAHFARRLIRGQPEMGPLRNAPQEGRGPGHVDPGNRLA